jgi:hypothetical protein
MATKTMVLITGNTYPVKDEIKELGGRWNAAEQGWMVPLENSDRARALVASAPVKAKPARSSTPARSYRSSSLGPRTGCSCGSRENGSQDTDCRSCRFDQDDC